MLHKCAVGGCANRSDTIIHYMLPKDPIRRSAWMKFMDDTTPPDEDHMSSSCRVCGEHFSEDSFFNLDLGYTTCKILSLDAVPTIHSNNRSCEMEGDDTCSITIAETVSLACVKEEPLEYDVDDSMTPQGDQNSTWVKCEEGVPADPEDIEVRECGRVEHKKAKKVKKGRSKTFNCLTCGEKFRGRSLLVKHQRAKHAKLKGEPEVKEKIIAHPGPAEEIPTRRLSSERTATEDNVGLYYKKHLCDHCGKRFAYESFLKAHLKVHEKGEAAMQHVCHLCPRRFGYKVALLAHLRQHVRKTESPCPICAKTFLGLSSLAQHIKTFHDKRKLLCKTCNHSFSKLNGYIKHMNTHNKRNLTQQDPPEHTLDHEKDRPSEEPKGPVASSKSTQKRGRRNRAGVSEQETENPAIM